ncbi:MAG: glycosyltransferase family 2 protein [Kiritimatiellia bacterium]|jgi:alpha-1,3-rhamnosyltransferase
MLKFSSQPPLLSVLIAAYNHGQYIAETMRSFYRQDYPNIEMIVIDDGSSDATYQRACDAAKDAPFEITVLTQENQGSTRTYNKLGHLANGELITFMGGDDLAIENTLMERANIVLDDERCMLCAGNGCYLRENGKTTDLLVDTVSMDKILRLSPEQLYFNETHNVNIIPCMYVQSMVIRKRLFDSIGGFDENFLADDILFRIKTYQYLHENNFSFRVIKKPVFYYRIHENNLHKNKAYIWKLYSQLSDRYLDDGGKAATKAGITYYKQYLRENNRAFNFPLLKEIYFDRHTRRCEFLCKVTLLSTRYALKQLLRQRPK